ncbi:MAG: pyridoxamine 5'-phosphate oxidase family protein [Candidatus Limnocylindria bacterium]
MEIPMGWLPDPVERLLGVALVGELTVVGRNGRPVTHPLIPLYHDGKIYLHSSTLFSKKLEHIKRDPRVSLAITDPVATKGNPDRATIQGTARLIEDDPHTDWDGLILRLWRQKEPSIDDFLKVRVALPLFFERAVIEITPERCLYWEDGRTDRAPVESRAPRQEAA